MSSERPNPLLEIPFEIPFDNIQPDDVEPAITSLLQRAEAAIDAVEAGAHNGAGGSYELTLGALEAATEELEVAMNVVGHLEAVASTPKLRQAYNAVRPTVSAFYARIPLRPKLWQVLSRFSESPAAATLDPTRARFLKKTLDDFRRHGANLDDQHKARLEALSRELAELTTRFSQNVVDATAAYELVIEDEAKLAGLPESARTRAKEDAQQKGKNGWRFTLQAPSLIPLLTYLDDRDLREQVYRAYNGRASSGKFDNTELIGRIVELRREQAEILGYDNFADLVLEDRMAKNYDAARRFVDDLAEKSRPAFDKETQDLIAFARGEMNDETFELATWDVGYFAEKLRKVRFDFDEEEVRPYFPLENVLEGLFETATRLYGVVVRKNEKLPVWHDEVRAFDLLDESGTHLASFYADLHPREQKRGGAWMNNLWTGTPGADGPAGPHSGLICANLTRPTGEKPALLTHQEVETLFHEFGHLLHHCLTRVSVRSLAGTNVAWDFVELPSQIMENWCWEREALDTFARHHQTGERIPDSLWKKMQAARTFRQASAMMRQLGFASVDLAVHVRYDREKDGDLLAYARRVMQPFSPAPLTNDYSMLTAFSHLFAGAVGYAVGYYSYKWAEVLDADAFTRFKKEGIFSRETGKLFRQAILERGDSRDPMELYKGFMGREPRLEALLERAGLDASQTTEVSTPA